MDSGSSSFSSAWTVVSVILFLAVELLIGTWIGPAVMNKYVSPMFHLQLGMIMHLVSFYLGGVLVGLLSPGIRMLEPAVGGFISVAVVFMISFFMPTWFYAFSWTKMLVGGTIAFFLALIGAYTGEQLMGNVGTEEEEPSLRGKIRSTLWEEEEGLFTSRKRPRR
jgi:hypothetical protein